MSSKSPTFLPNSRLSSKKQDQMAASVHARKRQVVNHAKCLAKYLQLNGVTGAGQHLAAPLA